MKSDLPYLQHIRDSIVAIENYVAGGRQAFLSERLIQDAVIRLRDHRRGREPYLRAVPRA